MEFAVWAQILTSVGATAFTLLIVQYIKPWKQLQSVDTRLIVFIVANILLQGAAFMMKLTWEDHVLLIINSFVVATAAIGSYQENALGFKAKDEQKKIPPGE